MRNRSVFIVTVPAGFEREAKEEIAKFIPKAKARSLFFKGNLLAKCSQERSEVIKSLREAPTLYVGRVFPVDLKARISSHKESLGSLSEKILLLGKLGRSDTFLVRCRRRGSHDFSSRDVEREIGSFLEQATGAVADFENPEKIVTVQIFQNLAFAGVTEVQNVLAKRVQVSRKYPKGERPFTRAEHKIKEAIEAFDLNIEEEFEVLDLGAAPGGWTRVLSSLARKVVAVDPANLDAAVAAIPNVVHLRCRAEEILDSVGQFHLVTDDMNMDPVESAKIVVGLADHIRKGGVAIMTVKFITRERERHIAEAVEILKAKYGNFKMKKLPHNRFETTLFMQKS